MSTNRNSRFRFAPLLAALCLLLPAFYQFSLAVELAAVKQEQSAALSDDRGEHLQTLVLTANAMREAKQTGSHEIRIGAHFYDVKNIQQKGTQFILTVLSDEREEALAAKLGQDQDNKGDAPDLQRQQVPDFQYELPLTDFSLQAPTAQSVVFFTPSRDICSITLPAPAPPPKCA